MKRIILVNQVAGPMFIDLANFYYNEGYHVHLLTGKLEETGQHISKAVTIKYFVKYRRNNALLRIITWILFSLQAYLYLRNEKQDSKVLLVSNPPFIPLLSHFLMKNQSLDFAILIYDVYPDVLEGLGYFTKKSFISKRWRTINVNAFNHAFRLFTISDGMKNVLSQYAPGHRWEVVYPWVDTSFIKPIPKEENPFVKKHNLLYKTLILYSGNMGESHDLMTIVKVAQKLDGISNHFFLFIGDGAVKKKLLSYSQKNNLQNTLFLPFQEPNVLPYSLTAADIGLVSLTGGASNLSVPSKTFYQMAAGNTILCISNPDSELANIVLAHNCGKVFVPESVNEIAEFLIKLDKSDIDRYGKNSRIASKKYSINNVQQFNF